MQRRRGGLRHAPSATRSSVSTSTATYLGHAQRVPQSLPTLAPIRHSSFTQQQQHPLPAGQISNPYNQYDIHNRRHPPPLRPNTAIGYRHQVSNPSERHLQAPSDRVSALHPSHHDLRRSPGGPQSQRQAAVNHIPPIYDQPGVQDSVRSQPFRPGTSLGYRPPITSFTRRQHQDPVERPRTSQAHHRDHRNQMNGHLQPVALQAGQHGHGTAVTNGTNRTNPYVDQGEDSFNTHHHPCVMDIFGNGHHRRNR